VQRKPRESDSNPEHRGLPDVSQETSVNDLDQGEALGQFTLDRQGRIIEVNNSGAALLGFAPAWLLKRAFVVFVARQNIQQFLNALLSLSRDHETEVIDVDLYLGEQTLPVQISFSVTFDPTLSFRLTVADLSEIRDSRLVLQESLAGWYSVIHNAPDVIFALDLMGRIKFVNKPFWGYSVNALMGTNILDYVGHEDRPAILKCLRQSFRFNRRTMCDIASPDGSEPRWLNYSFGTPHWNNNPAEPTTLAITLVVRETSKHKRTEEKLRASGKRLRDLAAHVETVLEEERTRVAREIHDELGQALTALRLDMAWVAKKIRGDRTTKKKLTEMMADVDDTIKRVRRISSDLRPPILDDLGIVPAIEWQLAQFRKRTKIRTELLCSEEGINLSSTAAAAVFRVIQEALPNVVRHARASKVSVKIEQVGGQVHIHIADNGKGMKRSDESVLKGLGITGMKERISRLGGRFQIYSEQGRGTRLDITVPLEHDQSLRR
jgi:PAS domain S-box-containing protein